jgi:Zincin-like metallopeptidase
MILDGVPIPGAIAEDGVTQAGVDARDAMWQQSDLLPDLEHLDDPAASIDRVIGGDTSGIDEAIA